MQVEVEQRNKIMQDKINEFIAAQQEINQKFLMEAIRERKMMWNAITDNHPDWVVEIKLPEEIRMNSGTMNLSSLIIDNYFEESDILSRSVSPKDKQINTEEKKQIKDEKKTVVVEEQEKKNQKTKTFLS